jgi:steroid delta-isomerase-like uncharacterized protein
MLATEHRVPKKLSKFAKTAYHSPSCSPATTKYPEVYLMSEQNEALIRRWFEEVWNNKNEAAIDELLDDDVVAYGLSDGKGGEVDNKAKFKALFHAFIQAYPDINVVVEETMSKDNHAFARCSVTGTHLGHGLGFSPTQKGVAFSGMLLIEVRDGKITKAWNEFNFLNMYEQLGALSLIEPA